MKRLLFNNFVCRPKFYAKNVHTLIKEFPNTIAEPISDVEFDKEMSVYYNAKRIGKLMKLSLGLAISGGSDSMALAVLVNRWRMNNKGRIELFAFIVNHNLREESLEEAKTVKIMLDKMRIPTKVATIEWQKFPKYKQLDAREERRKILHELCKDHDIPVLLLAHHKDDQIETFFTHFSFCSGILGLGSMPKYVKTNDLIIFKPLLPFEKERLIATCVHNNQKWVEDPSNNSLQTRSIFRRKLDDFYKRKIFEKNEFIQVMKFFQRQDEFIYQLQETFSQKYVLFEHEYRFAALKSSVFFSYPPEIAYFFLLDILKTFHFQKKNQISEKTLKNLTKELKTYDNLKIKSASHTFFFKTDDSIYITKELNKTSVEKIKFGETKTWENSFKIEISQYDKSIPLSEAIKELKLIEEQYKKIYGNDCYKHLYKCKIPGYSEEIYLDTDPNQEYTIQSIGEKGWLEFKKFAPSSAENLKQIPQPIRFTLPSIWLKNTVICIPSLTFKKRKAIFVHVEVIQSQKPIQSHSYPILL